MDKIKKTRKRTHKIPDSALLFAAEASESLSDLFRRLNVRISGGAYYHYTKRLERLGVDLSRLKSSGGKIRAKGSNQEAVKNAHGRIRRKTLNKHMELHGVEYKCFTCGLTHWNGKEILLHIHHKDHNRANNLIENLCYLCPNCHSVEHYGEDNK